VDEEVPVSKPELLDQKRIARVIATSASASEKEALRLWIEKLLALIGDPGLSTTEKAKHALRVTSASRIVLPSLKLAARELKRVTWDDRGLKSRMGIGSAAAAIALFGGQGAGIAALGTAIGVPLWVVFGAGGAFLGLLYEELTGRKPPPPTTYTVIDAEKVKRDS
jgi:hypothetical protein